MRTFDYREKPTELYTPELVMMLVRIHEYKGRQELLLRTNESRLQAYTGLTVIQKAAAAYEIEAFDEDSEEWEESLVTFAWLKDMIRECYQLCMGNSLDLPEDKEETALFSMLCTEFASAWEDDYIDRLLLIPVFLLDLMCVLKVAAEKEQFLLMVSQILLDQAGYQAGRYVRTEPLMERSRRTYQNVFRASTALWEEEGNDYGPFLVYYLGIVSKTFSEFEKLTEQLVNTKISKPDRIISLIDNARGSITKRRIMEEFPDISKVTVERTLTSLVKDGYIEKIGGGPATAYVKVDI